MVKLTTRERIIFALVRKDGQLNKELIKNADTNHNSLSIELKKLENDNIIEKTVEDNRYWLSTKLENKVLNALGSAYTVLKSMDAFGEELKKDDNPFKKGSAKITEIIRLLVMLRLERFATPKQELTKRDKLEFDLYFDMFDALLEWIFEILNKDEKKTKFLKIELMKSVRGK